METEKKPDILIAKEEYCRRFEQGLLKNNKICEFFVKKEEKILKIVMKNENNKEKEVQKKQIAHSEMEHWNFDFMTVDDENPNIMLSSYLQQLAVFKTKRCLDQSHKK